VILGRKRFTTEQIIPKLREAEKPLIATTREVGPAVGDEIKRAARRGRRDQRPWVGSGVDDGALVDPRRQQRERREAQQRVDRWYDNLRSMPVPRRSPESPVHRTRPSGADLSTRVCK